MTETHSSDPQKSAQHSVLFVECVTSYAHQAMIAMGKIVNPITKKAEKNLEVARFFIDMLEMLEAKTKGNLSKDEERFLAQTVSSARLTYVEEVNAAEAAPPTTEEQTAPAAPTDTSATTPKEEESKKRFTKKYD